MSDTKNKDHGLKPRILELATAIQTGVEINKETGLGSEKEPNSIFAANLPEGLTVEIDQQLSEYKTDLGAAAVYASGQLAIDAMKANKALERVTVEIGMGGKDSFTTNVDRQKAFNNHLTGSGEVIKYGVISTGYETIAGKNAGQLKKAKVAIGELALETLAK